MAVTAEHTLAHFTQWARIWRGRLAAEAGDGREGVALLQEALSAARATGTRYWSPFYTALLADAHKRAGDAKRALEVLADALEQVERTDQRVYELSAKLPEAKKHLAETISENWSDQLELGGSQSGYVAFYAANQVLGTIWRGGKEDPDTKEVRDEAALRRVAEIGARDVIEGMLAAQMVATHEAAMKCFRRAARAEQTLAGREMGLKFADRLVRSFVALTEALDRHRGKGQQVVRVEHVTVRGRGAGDRRCRHPDLPWRAKICRNVERPCGFDRSEGAKTTTAT